MSATAIHYPIDRYVRTNKGIRIWAGGVSLELKEVSPGLFRNETATRIIEVKL